MMIHIDLPVDVVVDMVLQGIEHYKIPKLVLLKVSDTRNVLI